MPPTDTAVPPPPADEAAPATPVVPATPVNDAAVSPVTPAPVSGSAVTGPIWAKIADRPGHTGELLALAAVETLGPRAREWAAQMRATYPAAAPDALARLATMRSSQTSAAAGMLAATTGAYAPLVEYTSVAWVQAALVLRVAAAHGADPADPERAVDLLVLLRLHSSRESARAALDAAVGEHGAGLLRAHPLEGIWRLATPLAARVVGWAALRTAARLIPGAAALVAALTDAAATDLLAARAVAYYRKS